MCLLYENYISSSHNKYRCFYVVVNNKINNFLCKVITIKIIYTDYAG